MSGAAKLKSRCGKKIQDVVTVCCVIARQLKAIILLVCRGLIIYLGISAWPEIDSSDKN